MPIIYASTDDGYVGSTNQSSWSNARDATSGTGKNTIATSNSVFTAVAKGLSRGGGITYTVYRTFMYFDTSGITGTVASATLSVRGAFSNDGSVIAVKSDAFGGDGGTALANADFNNIVGWSATSSLDGLATVYGAQILTSSWNTSGYNNFTAIICFMDYTNDYLNVAVSSGFLNTGAWMANYTGTSRDPKIDYTLATGYGHEVNNVGASSIAKVKGVATASIAKVIGVD
jgi:hypothetical protein